MKKLLATIAIACFSISAVFAQEKKTKAPVETVSMKGHKLWLNKDGKMSEVKEKFVTANGHIVNPDGEVVLNTGKVVRIDEGQTLKSDGKIDATSPNVHGASSAVGR